MAVTKDVERYLASTVVVGIQYCSNGPLVMPANDFDGFSDIALIEIGAHVLVVASTPRLTRNDRERHFIELEGILLDLKLSAD